MWPLAAGPPVEVPQNHTGSVRRYGAVQRVQRHVREIFDSVYMRRRHDGHNCKFAS